MLISDIKTFKDSITMVTFVERPAHRSDKERWAICMTLESMTNRTDSFIEFRVAQRVTDKTREWRSIDAAKKAIEPMFDQFPTMIIQPIHPKEKNHEK